MVWVRGNAADYDGWATRGCPGWDYGTVRPSLDALTGPVRPSNTLPRRNALSRATVDAAVGVGYEYNPDYNGDSQFGVAYTQLNVIDGIRQDAFTTFLSPYRDARRLTLHATNATDAIRPVGEAAPGLTSRMISSGSAS